MSDRLRRGTYLGGQQIAAVVGQHPFMSIGEVYVHATTGETEDISEVGVIRRGIICEPGILQWVREQLKIPLGRSLDDVFTVDDDVPFFAGTQDMVEIDENGVIVHVHEVTVTSSWMADKWGEDGDPQGPMRYKWIQCQWYQGITGATNGTIWLFIADTGEIRSYPCPRNDKAIERLRDAGEEFWLECVLPNVPPEPEKLAGIAGWANVNDSLDAMYPDNKNDETEPTKELVEAAFAYDDARDRHKQAEEDKRAAQGRMKAILQDNGKAAWEGGSVTWRRNKPTKKTDYEKAYASLKAMAVGKGLLTKDDADKHEKGYEKEVKGPRVMRVSIKKQTDEETNDE